MVAAEIVIISLYAEVVEPEPITIMIGIIWQRTPGVSLIKSEVMMDNTDKRILEIIQYDFPLTTRPYKVIGEKLDLSEKEVFERVSKLKKDKIIRRVGGIFSSKKLGYTSLLCAIKTSPLDADRVAEIINLYPGVTHNYKRNHDYNVWFTLITENEEIKDKIIKEIEEKSGYTVKRLPAKKLFKLRAVFKIPGGEK